MIEALGPDVLPRGVRARFVDGVNGLRVHVLEAGNPEHPCVLLLHGFRELAYFCARSCRRCRWLDAVIVPDQRGYGHHRLGCRLRRR
jgi:non-specific protein-tyrosine kinase